MANLLESINALKKVLKERANKKASRRSGSSDDESDDDGSPVNPSKEEWDYRPPSTWATQFSYIPILFGIGHEGAVVMYVKKGRGNQAGYIYPRVPYKVFAQYMETEARGGAIYWGKGVKPLKEYSVAARRVGKRVIVKGRIGAKQVRMRGIAFPTTAVSKTRRAVTMYRQIPKSVRIHK